MIEHGPRPPNRKPLIQAAENFSRRSLASLRLGRPDGCRFQPVGLSRPPPRQFQLHADDARILKTNFTPMFAFCSSLWYPDRSRQCRDPRPQRAGHTVLREPDRWAPQTEQATWKQGIAETGQDGYQGGHRGGHRGGPPGGHTATGATRRAAPAFRVHGVVFRVSRMRRPAPPRRAGPAPHGAAYSATRNPFRPFGGMGLNCGLSLRRVICRPFFPRPLLTQPPIPRLPVPRRPFLSPAGWGTLPAIHGPV